ncbi:MAG: 4-demethylwyosine synthase TYW1 [Candidatus Thermoplasmatota archaeon]|jgi:tRNA wybutosine-synthesizing protein 1|nr:4-demethylwyosine synthase TYW1 [Candidatus Thermoplasmatota archaeon]
MNSEFRKILEKQHYAIVGEHSAVKVCHWVRQSLLFKRECYKQTFYGIKSHRCLQMTPSVNQCNHMCLFCWRYQGFPEKNFKVIDEPKFILDKSIEMHKKLITGFKGDKRCDQKKFKEANKPNMIACSLSGEPTLYPRLGEFFEECKKRKITTFLVTNGTNPEALEKLNPLPDQLYISIVAPNKEIYKKICSPMIPNLWEKIIQTLELIPSLNTRTVIRHTLVKGWNMDKKYIKEYSKLDEKADPMFIEPKGYVFVGYSRKRMNLSNMPSHKDIYDFGITLQDYLGYKLVMEKPDSRVVLLSKEEKMERFDK